MIDLDEISERVGRVVAYSQGYKADAMNPKRLVEQWYEAKKPFIDLFGGKTIIEISNGEIATSITGRKKYTLFYDFMQELLQNNLLPSREFERFLENNKETFFENKIAKDYICATFSAIIPAGLKLSKAFKYFIEDKEKLRLAQDIASRYMQLNKITGHVYLSVDPVDFLTSSENNSKWRSCHSLDGDYRGGNLSYMTDKCTMICYLANEAPEQLKSMPHGMLWNNKKWRVLAFAPHIDFNTPLYISRQYPFTQSVLLEHLLNFWIKDTFYDEITGDDKINNHQFLNFEFGWRDHYVDASQLIVDSSCSLNYNDLLYSSLHVATLYMPTRFCVGVVNCRDTGAIEEHAEIVDDLIKTCRIYPGSQAPTCPYCGNAPVRESSALLCDHCLGKYPSDAIYCADCGERIYKLEDDLGETEDGYIICRHCMEGD